MEEWSSKEIRALEKRIIDLLERISKYPKICPPASKHPNIRKGIVDKNNYIVYRIRPQNKIIDHYFQGNEATAIITSSKTGRTLLFEKWF
ncbi:MAG: type II toxin-antitoxin system RelE/ParE family toxin [Leeuwenhoekiella sp.]